ncbi:MAG: hypothetical protein ISR52_02045 [Rhodospirillales bacterium]|nr:hypothetical protein [Rhodospirillales bacterium]
MQCLPTLLPASGKSVLTGFAAVLVILLAQAAAVNDARADRYATSVSPYWRVGDLDKVLSDACQRGEFNQRQTLKLTIGFLGKQGPATTGIANKDYNLRDPKGLAQKGYTFHFYNDGYSNCRVYVSGRRR